MRPFFHIRSLMLGLMLLPAVAFGQEDAPPLFAPETSLDKKVGVNLNLSYLDGPFSSISSLSFVVNHKRHQFMAGPTILETGTRPDGLKYKPSSYNHRGLEFAYRFKPASLHRRTNWFIAYNLSYSTANQMYWNIRSFEGTDRATEFNDRIRFLTNSLGVGSDFHFKEYFYLDLTAGASFSHEGFRQELEIDGNPIERQVINSGMIARPLIDPFVRIGIGINIPDFSLYD